MLPEVARAIPSGAVVTDVGSTKRDLMALAQKHFTGERFFIGGHPMTGLEKGGWENSEARLFENAIYVLTLPLHVPTPLLEALQDFLAELGARVMLLEPEEHDRIAAEISHLPHLLAITLTNFIAREGVKREPRLQMAGRGFRDMTRIAASPFPIWRDILHTNHDNVQQALQEFTLALQQLTQELERDELKPRFQNAQQLQQQMSRGSAA